MPQTLDSTTPKKTTPMMAQWHACKRDSKDALLFFRMGDFYEAFYDDAILMAKELGISLTKRQEIPMCGVPHHTIEGYIDKLVAKGFKVAVAEQTEDPKKTKGLVKREVVRVVTPGTVVSSSLLAEKSNNYFASINQVGSIFGLAFLDLTTSEFQVIELESIRDLSNETLKLGAKEILVSKKMYEKHEQFFKQIKAELNCLINTVDEWHFSHNTAYESLTSHFKVHTLDGFGVKGMVPAINAAGALINYIRDQLSLPAHHITFLKTFSIDSFMGIDAMTARNLELTESLKDQSTKNTLLQVLDATQTPMGGRLLRSLVKRPLMKVDRIKARQEAVSALIKESETIDHGIAILSQIRDLERLMMRITTNFATPRDLVTLRLSLEKIPELSALLEKISSPLLDQLKTFITELPKLTNYIKSALVDEPPARISDCGLIRDGFNDELDELRDIKKNSQLWLQNHQESLREKLGIKTLKAGFNRVFGYYLEVSKGQASLMPETFIRRQTLTNCERFISPELKDFEKKVLGAEERISSIELQLFQEALKFTIGFQEEVLTTAKAIATFDCISSFAYIAHSRGYTCPLIDESDTLLIEGGKHPVVEHLLESEPFVPNDTYAIGEKGRMAIITGPNMAGKSTYIRQVALLTIMAQIGSFIPATKAHIGLIDKVFTRIGASDDLSRGQSTFMVEMTETATILHNATFRSLVILDEIGRGTSTYDGIAIAWSVAEFLINTKEKQAKTLFATHYFELTDLEKSYPSVSNYHIAASECDEQVIFLRKVLAGIADKSYGVHVAKLAGLPKQVLQRAQTILAKLEESGEKIDVMDENKKTKKGRAKKKVCDIQLSLFQSERYTPPKPNPAVEVLCKLDLNALSPMEALTKLFELQSLAKHN